MRTIGIDIGGTKIYAGTSVDGHLERTVYRKTPTTLVEFMDLFKSIVVELTSEFSDCQYRLGVAIPGSVKSDGHVWVPNIPYLTGLNLVRELESLSGAQVFMANDAQCGLLGEVCLGAAQGAKDVILISIGTGIGGAILLDGEIRTGASGVAGAFGWMPLDHRLGVQGSFESLASGTALNRLASAYLPDMSSRELLKQLMVGEAESVEVINHWISLLGAGIAGLVSLLNPSVVLLTGGLIQDAEPFLGKLREVVSSLACPVVRDTPLLPARLANEAVMYGAVCLAEQEGKLTSRYRKRG